MARDFLDFFCDGSISEPVCDTRRIFSSEIPHDHGGVLMAKKNFEFFSPAWVLFTQNISNVVILGTNLVILD